MNAPSTQSVSTETPLRPKLPLRLGRFTLCEELGAGGMATVYLARMGLAAGIEKPVALKTIHPHLAREKPFVDMFLDEARIASHVSHPNVCAVHDFGEMDGVYYLAMEHLLGEPLFDVINRLVVRFDEVREVLPYLAARVVADACEGLHAAHVASGPDGQSLHIVHRDVSPQNLFVTYDGTVKVVDFGCAKAAQRVAHTSTGVMKGKVGYAAPEQLRADDVDARADVWALGVCLWEALTLSPLFTKETAMKTAMSVLEAPIGLASEDRPWVPEAVARIAEKALSRDREARYASARDLSRDLRKFIADSGYTLEAAELAEWMDFLFEERRSERAQQLARVRELDVSNVARAAPEMLGVASSGDVQLLEGSISAVDAIDDDAPAEDPLLGAPEPPELPASRDPAHADAEAEPAPADRAPAPRTSGRKWLVALAVLLALGGVGFYVQLNYEPAPWFLELFGLPRAPEPGARPEAGSSGAAAEDPGEPAPGEEPTTGTGEDEPALAARTEVPAAPSEALAPDAGTSGAAGGNRANVAPVRRRPRESTVTTVVSGGGAPPPAQPGDFETRSAREE